jgi:hypothetical protein
MKAHEMPGGSTLWAHPWTTQHGGTEGSVGSSIGRRGLLTGLGSLVIFAPSIVRASSLMPVKVMESVPLASPSDEIQSTNRPSAGFLERLAYHFMDHVLRTGWTSEKAAGFYGGMSEDAMRRAVARARRHGFLK